MAILTGFVRQDRRHEIDGCPLNDGGDEAVCATCPWNALDPGRPRVGCQVQSPAAEVTSAFARLATLDPEGHRQVREILAAQAKRREDEGLNAAEVAVIAAVVARWAPLVSGDVGEQHVVALLQRFTAGAKKTGEAIRVLS